MNHNNTAAGSVTDDGGFLGSGHIGGFGYGIGVSVGILLLITTITLTSYFCTKNNAAEAAATRRRPMNNAAAGQARQDNNNNNNHQNCVVEIGLDETTLLSYPKMLFSEAKVNHKDSTASCCSICLADYKSSDILRLLPDCDHLFHLKCVDPWLRHHPTCPVCRTSPLPTPQSTPLAEVVPLATRPIR